MKSPRRSLTEEIDWPQLHERLAKSAAAARQVMTPSRDLLERVLDERARRLARPLAVERTGAVWLDITTFALASERYAIETRYVREVLRNLAVTPVPGVPDVVAGVANMRGEILAVFDVRRLLGLPVGEATTASRLLICGTDRADLALLTDTVGDVVRLSADELQPGTSTRDPGSENFIRGITGDATILIDGAALLADPRLFTDQPRAAALRMENER